MSKELMLFGKIVFCNDLSKDQAFVALERATHSPAAALYEFGLKERGDVWSLEGTPLGIQDEFFKNTDNFIISLDTDPDSEAIYPADIPSSHVLHA